MKLLFDNTVHLLSEVHSDLRIEELQNGFYLKLQYFNKDHGVYYDVVIQGNSYN